MADTPFQTNPETGLPYSAKPFIPGSPTGPDDLIVDVPKQGRFVIPRSHLVPTIPEMQRTEEIHKAYTLLDTIQEIGTSMVKKAPAVGQWLVQSGKEAILPTVMGAAGGFLSGPAAPLGVAAGTGAGMYTNYLAGITPEAPSGTDYMIGMGLSAAGPMSRGIVRELPGAEMGLHQAAVKDVGRKIESMRPSPSAASLYAALPHNQTVPLQRVAAVSAQLAQAEAKIAAPIRLSGVSRLVQAGLELSQSGQVPDDVFRANLTRFGALVRASKRKPWAGEAKLLYSALMDDLDSVPLGAPLKKAAVAYKRELAVDELTKLLQTRGIGMSAGVDVLSSEGLYKAIRTNEQLKRLIPASELDEIQTTLRAYSKSLPKPEATAQPGLQGMPIAQRLVIGGAVGGLIGGSRQSSIIGALATEGLGRALSSRAGRFMIRNMAQHQVSWDTTMNLLAQMARAGVLGKMDEE